MSRVINPNKENNEKLALKREGHALINNIKWKGYSLDKVYYLLAQELHVEEHQAHFSYMQSRRELGRAVQVLRMLYHKLPDTKFKSKPRKSYPQPKVWIKKNPSYNIHMSINREAVKEIYNHDGEDAALLYLTEKESATQEEAKRILAVIVSKPAIATEPQLPTTFYCVKDNELVVEDTNTKTAICPNCQVDLSKETAEQAIARANSSDIITYEATADYTQQRQPWYKRLWPFKLNS